MAVTPVTVPTYNTFFAFQKSILCYFLMLFIAPGDLLVSFTTPIIGKYLIFRINYIFNSVIFHLLVFYIMELKDICIL